MSRGRHRRHRDDPAYVTVAELVRRCTADRLARVTDHLAATDPLYLRPAPPTGGDRCPETPTR